jgi:sugar-specific transcriptional regulator TrmB
MAKIRELEQKLGDSGLNEKERAVYIAILEMGGRGFPSAIAKKAGVNRSTAYKILLSLSIKGLVDDIEKKNKVYYQLSKPEKLIQYVDQQNKELMKKLDNVKKIAPELKELFSSLAEAPRVTFFEGYREVSEIYKDMIHYGDYEMLSFFNAKEFEHFLDKQALEDFVTDREKKRISMRAILPDSEEDKTYFSRIYSRIDKKYFPEKRCIPEKIFPFDGDITVYGKNKIAIIKLNKESIDAQLIGVVIEDSLVHGMMKMIFELAWEGAKKYA